MWCEILPNPGHRFYTIIQNSEHCILYTLKLDITMIRYNKMCCMYCIWVLNLPYRNIFSPDSPIWYTRIHFLYKENKYRHNDNSNLTSGEHYLEHSYKFSSDLEQCVTKWLDTLLFKGLKRARGEPLTSSGSRQCSKKCEILYVVFSVASVFLKFVVGSIKHWEATWNLTIVAHVASIFQWRNSQEFSCATKCDIVCCYV